MKWIREFFRPFWQSVCRHETTSATTKFDPESYMGRAGWAFMDWKCEDCGLTRHRIVPAPPEMHPDHQSLQMALLRQAMEDEAHRNRLH